LAEHLKWFGIEAKIIANDLLVKCDAKIRDEVLAVGLIFDHKDWDKAVAK